MDPDNPGPEGARRWPGCSTTRASTSRWPATPTRSSARGRRQHVGGRRPPRTTSAQHHRAAARAHRRRALGDRGRRRPRASPTRSAPRGGSAATLGGAARPGCDDPLYDGLTLEVDTATVYPDGDCFDGKGGAVVAEPEDGLALFGADQALTNDQILRADNAAVALRLLGPGRPAGLVRPLARRPRRRRRRQPPVACSPGGPARARARAGRPAHRDRLAGPPARAAGHRAAAGRGPRRRDHAQPGPALPPLRRPRPRGRVAAPGRARPARRTAAARLRHRRPTRSSARWPAAPDRSADDVAALLGPAGAVPSTDRDLITLAKDLAELDREVRRT